MSDDNFMAEVRQVFNEESNELLEDFEAILLKLEEEPTSNDLIHELFRTVHTIKGSSGIIGYDDVVKFTHIAESVLGRLRDQELALDEDLSSLLLASCDQTRGLIRHAIGAPGQPLPDEVVDNGKLLLTRLHAYLDGTSPPPADAVANAVAAATVSEPTASGQVGNDFWHISLRMQADAMQQGLDPLYFFNFLAKLGEIVHLSLLSTELPPILELQAENLYLGFEIDLDTTVSKEEIASVFDFMRGECDLHILPPRSKVADYMLLINTLPEESMAIGEILVASGALTESELEEALEIQRLQAGQSTETADDIDAPLADTKPQLGSVLVEKGLADSKVIDAALQQQKRVREAKRLEHQSVRVSSEKLGDLINLVGELVIFSAHVELKARQTEENELHETTDRLIRLVEMIRDASLTLRMVQVGDTFNRYKRVVRDTSRELGKRVDLIITGGETELDKTVVEKISDPLMHLIRNALDHGVETPEQRVAQGKALTAIVSLQAYHESGSIVIELSDDGKGLDPELLLAKAIENGVINSGQQLSLQEIHRLIFAPGFSTADEVTSLSGRGVGMDVVNRNIDALRGEISVESELGVGTRFIIRLPLTLAIIDGFQVQVGKSSYVIPLNLVEECIELDDFRSGLQQGDYFDLRGEVMPYLHLSELFSEASLPASKKQHYNLVIVQYAGQKTGLVVDAFLGEHQTVIKPLGQVFQNLNCISGATILGDGEVAMIIDVPALVSHATASSQHGSIPGRLN